MGRLWRNRYLRSIRRFQSHSTIPAHSISITNFIHIFLLLSLKPGQTMMLALANSTAPWQPSPAKSSRGRLVIHTAPKSPMSFHQMTNHTRAHRCACLMFLGLHQRLRRRTAPVARCRRTGRFRSVPEAGWRCSTEVLTLQESLAQMAPHVGKFLHFEIR